MDITIYGSSTSAERRWRGRRHRGRPAAAQLPAEAPRRNPRSAVVRSGASDGLRSQPCPVLEAGDPMLAGNAHTVSASAASRSATGSWPRRAAIPRSCSNCPARCGPQRCRAVSVSRRWARPPRRWSSTTRGASPRSRSRPSGSCRAEQADLDRPRVNTSNTTNVAVVASSGRSAGAAAAQRSHTARPGTPRARRPPRSQSGSCSPTAATTSGKYAVNRRCRRDRSSTRPSRRWRARYRQPSSFGSNANASSCCSSGNSDARRAIIVATGGRRSTGEPFITRP